MVDPPSELSRCQGFQWDDGNGDKNWHLHQVTRAEAEQVFFNRPLHVAQDKQHSHQEQRLAALGRTDQDRRLAIVFTIRGRLIRVISARDMSRKERALYERQA